MLTAGTVMKAPEASRNRASRVPGLSLTLPQAARLWGIDRTCELVQANLIERRVLKRALNGTYVRRWLAQLAQAQSAVRPRNSIGSDPTTVGYVQKGPGGHHADDNDQYGDSRPADRREEGDHDHRPRVHGQPSHRRRCTQPSEKRSSRRRKPRTHIHGRSRRPRGRCLSIAADSMASPFVLQFQSARLPISSVWQPDPARLTR